MQFGGILPLIADGDPLARGWIPLPAVGVVSSRPAPAASNPKASATAAAAAAPTASAAATRAAMASAAMSRATASRAAMTPAAAATSAAAAMTPAAAATSAAAAVTCCKSQASAKRGGLAFFVEDAEGRQADVRDFLLSENNSRCGALRRYIRCERACRCAARHCQRNPRRSQYQGCPSTPPFGTLLRPRHSGPLGQSLRRKRHPLTRRCVGKMTILSNGASSIFTQPAQALASCAWRRRHSMDDLYLAFDLAPRAWPSDR